MNALFPKLQHLVNRARAYGRRLTNPPGPAPATQQGAVPLSADLDEARQKVALAPNWYHAFELLPGLVTPGKVPIRPREHLDCYGVEADLAGVNALEIGTMDGPIAFELERRGARVKALDIQDPSRTGFDTAKSILGSEVQYVQGSIYDLRRLFGEERFDLIACFGVFYHLKSPVLAFEEIAAVMNDKATLMIEGECLLNYAEEVSGKPVDKKPLAALTSDRLPLALFYSGSYKGDDTNWFVPNLACVKEWLKAAGLELKRHWVLSRNDVTPPVQRLGGVVEKVGGSPVEHRTF